MGERKPETPGVGGGLWGLWSLGHSQLLHSTCPPPCRALHRLFPSALPRQVDEWRLSSCSCIETLKPHTKCQVLCCVHWLWGCCPALHCCTTLEVHLGPMSQETTSLRAPACGLYRGSPLPAPSRPQGTGKGQTESDICQKPTCM